MAEESSNFGGYGPRSEVYPAGKDGCGPDHLLPL